jgi:hypothetical protein
VPGGARKTTLDDFELACADDSYSRWKSSGEDIVENKTYKNDWLLFYVMCKD